MTTGAPDRDRLPVTIVSGYLGAGKTTLLNHVLTNQQGYRVAVLVNDMGEINVDAQAIARENEAEGIIDLSNGCICCRLQGDLLEEAHSLAQSRDFNALLVESSGISEPVPVARVFLEGTPDSDVDPTAHFDLDSMVTVVDAFGFWKEFDAGESLPGGAPDPERPMSEVLIEGIEICDLLVLNKCDLVPDDVLDEIDATLETLQPEARRVHTVGSEVDPGLVIDTGRFDFEAVRRSPGWKRRLASGEHDHDQNTHHDHNHGHDHPPAATRAGVSSIVFESPEPFDPAALAGWLEPADWDGSILRTKGVCHVAGTDDVIGVSQAGPSVRAGPIGTWEPDDDRVTRLVIIGRDLEEAAIRAALEGCLLEAVEGAGDDGGDGQGQSGPSTDPDPDAVFPLEAVAK